MARTRLTSVPGQPLDDERLERGDGYSPGLTLPTEPTWPSRFRNVWVLVLTVAVAAAILAVFVLLNERGNSFDPALDPDRFGPSQPASNDPAGDPSDGLLGS